MRYSTFPIILILGLSLQSCDKKNYLDLETAVDPLPLLVQGEYQGPDEDEFEAFVYRFDETSQYFRDRYLFWNASVFETPLGASLLVGAYDSNLYATAIKYFGMQFWSENMPTQRQWTKEELEGFFPPGKVFHFNKWPDVVEVTFRYPKLDDKLSQIDIYSSSGFLEEPTGELKIIALAEYTYTGVENLSIPNDSKGMYITCEINGYVGLNREIPTPFSGPNGFQATESLELRNVEATFFVKY